jgi:hypothetical protein
LKKALTDQRTHINTGRRTISSREIVVFSQTTDLFSIHANMAVPAYNRTGLERLSRPEDGKVRLALSNPGPAPEGVSEFAFEPVAFLRRLSPLIPPPYAHLIRYFGLLPSSALSRLPLLTFDKRMDRDGRCWA